MIPISRFVLALAVVLTVVYVSLWFYFRAGARDRLAGVWARDRPPLPEHTFVETEMRAYEPVLRRKLIVGVYVIPLTAAIGLAMILNAL
ncbi:hypothetical protein N9W17_00120 [Jannaschia sp.]|nr:hypothetical protein [Jannaschia sp.]